MNKLLNWVFALGAIAMMNLYGIAQDQMGKEKYLQFAQENWTDSTVSMPIHILFFFGSLFIFFYIKAKMK